MTYSYLLLGVRTYGAPQSLKMRRRFKSLSSLFVAALKIIPSEKVTVYASEEEES